MRKYKVFYEKKGDKDWMVLYANSEKDAKAEIEESFGSVGYKVMGVEPIDA